MKSQPIFIIIAITAGLIILAITGVAIYALINPDIVPNGTGGLIGYLAILWTGIKTKLFKFPKLKKFFGNVVEEEDSDDEELREEVRRLQEEAERRQEEEAKVMRLQRKNVVMESAKFQLRDTDLLYDSNLINMATVHKAMEMKGHTIYDGTNGSNGLNIIGVRHYSATSNKFNDSLIAMWKDEATQTWEFRRYKGTTDAGLHYRLNKMNVKGTAILKEGQYPEAYKIGRHTTYTALEQCGNLTVIRDDNGDNVLDFQAPLVETGDHFKINIHRSNASTQSTQVDKWSAGCQVFAKKKEWDEFLNICKKAAADHGELFTYTLLHIDDIVEAVGELEVEGRMAA